MKVLAPYAPGGATDTGFRIMAPAMAETPRQTVVIENRTRASGNIAVELAANAAPDGYTLLMGTISTDTINPALFGGVLKVNPLRDLTGISLVTAIPNVLLSSAQFPPNSLSDVIACAVTSSQWGHSLPNVPAMTEAGSGALGIAVSEARGVRQNPGSMTKPYYAGAAAGANGKPEQHCLAPCVSFAVTAQASNTARVRPKVIARIRSACKTLSANIAKARAISCPTKMQPPSSHQFRRLNRAMICACWRTCCHLASGSTDRTGRALVSKAACQHQKRVHDKHRRNAEC